MDVFHVFSIEQILPNRAKRLNLRVSLKKPRLAYQVDKFSGLLE